MFGAQCPDCAVWLHCSAVSVLVSRTCFIAYSSSTAAAGPGCAVQCPHLALETSPHSVRQWVCTTEGSSDVTGAVPVTLSRSVTCHAVRDWCLQVGRGQWVGSSRRWNLGYAEHQGCERVRVPSNSQQTTDTGAEIMWRRGRWWQYWASARKLKFIQMDAFNKIDLLLQRISFSPSLH